MVKMSNSKLYATLGLADGYTNTYGSCAYERFTFRYDENIRVLTGNIGMTVDIDHSFGSRSGFEIMVGLPSEFPNAERWVKIEFSTGPHPQP